MNARDAQTRITFKFITSGMYREEKFGSIRIPNWKCFAQLVIETNTDWQAK